LAVDAVLRGVPTRRTLLGAGALGLAGLAGLAGTSIGGADGPARLRDRRSVLDRYLYAPGAFDRNHYTFYFARPRRIAAVRSGLDADLRDFLSRRVDVANPAELPFERIADHVIADPNTAAMRVDGDRATLAAALRDEGFRRTGAYGDYAVFETTANEPRADAVVAAVRDGVLLACEYGDRPGAVARTRAMADAGAGERPRYVRTAPELGVLVELFAGTTVGVGSTRPAPSGTNPDVGVFAGLVADGFGIAVGAERTTTRAGFVFERPEDVDRPALAEYVAAQRSARPDTDLAFDVRVEGRVVTVDWTLPTADF